MEFCSSNYEDIRRYFGNAYVKLPETGDKLFLIEHVSPRDIVGMTEDGDKFRIYLSNDLPYSVDYVLPKKSFFQHGKYAVLLRRNPARQYQRGLSPNNTTMRYLKADGTWGVMDIDFPSLKGYVNKPAFLPLNEVVANKQKFYSYALSPRLAFCTRTKHIFLDDLLVAEVLVKDKVIMMHHPIFKDEVNKVATGSIFEGKVQ